MDPLIILFVVFGWVALMLKPSARSVGFPKYNNPPAPPKNKKKKSIGGIPHSRYFK